MSDRATIHMNFYTAAVQALRIYVRTVSPVASVTRHFIRQSGSVGVRAISCLDIGAGTVPYAAVIQRVFETVHYIAMDIAPSDRCNLVGDGCALPFTNETLDLIVSFEVIQHVATPAQMLAEVMRVLRPGGHVLLTFPFLYAECDFHDYHRWTMEGMSAELVHHKFDIILAQRRGGAFFVAACALNWAIQHAIPGQRRSWRADRSLPQVLRAALMILLTVPTTALQWLALLVDRLLVVRGCYIGGTILARKRVD
jgi:SAM-dependent methyltransferase